MAFPMHLKDGGQSSPSALHSLMCQGCSAFTDPNQKLVEKELGKMACMTTFYGTWKKLEDCLAFPATQKPLHCSGQTPPSHGENLLKQAFRRAFVKRARSAIAESKCWKDS